MSDTVVGNMVRRVLKLIREEYRSCCTAKAGFEVASAEEAKMVGISVVAFDLIHVSLVHLGPVL